MTTKFGRTTPSQMLMLALAGIDDSINLVDVELSDEEKMNKMVLGRKLLQKMTGMDFGFDLAIWRNFFMTNDKNDEYGYKHPYAFENVDKAIQLAILDTNRKQIIDVRAKRANELLNMFLNSQLISFSTNSASNIPEISGVYRIVESDLTQKNTVYIGHSKNIHSHLMGKKVKSILQRISSEKNIDSYSLQLILLNEIEKDWFAQFAIEKLSPLVYDSTPT